ncbi:MAG: M12 family metallopeptidase [Betaproteobacteria bacterium]
MKKIRFAPAVQLLTLVLLLLTQSGANADAVERYRTLFRDRVVTYVERNGLAITEGDIVLGTAAELALRRDARPSLKGLTIDDATRLWGVGPSGAHEVPYIFEAGPQASIDAAIATFNATFPGIIQWVPRVAQDDYVTFNLVGPAGSCFSSVGRVGGRQTIGGTPICSVGALLHEMGHAIGFWHTQSDEAQNRFIDIRYDMMDPLWRSQYVPQLRARTLDGYDYASIMHYSQQVESMTADPITTFTRPVGIDIGLRAGYSTGDIDAVKRLYGGAPQTVTVTSNPPGLEVTVDGVTGITPMALPWRIGSLHRLDVPAALQNNGGFKFAFGRWSHDPGATPAAAQEWVVDPGEGFLGQPVTAPRNGVLVANFIRLQQVVQPVVSGAAFGTFSATAEVPAWPGTTDWYPQLTRFDLSAQPNAGFLHTWFTNRFFTLTGGGGGVPSAARRIGTTTPIQIGATFFAGPGLVVKAAGAGIDGTLRANVTSPGSSQPVPTLVPTVLRNTLAGTYTIAADAIQFRSDSVRFVLQSIDGLDDPLTGLVAMPAPGEDSRVVTLNVQKQFAPVTQRVPSCGGSVTLSNTAAWLPFGTQLSVTAQPVSGVVFAGWGGTFAGASPANGMSVDRVPEVVAYFNLIPERFALDSISPPTYRKGQGGVTLEFKGNGFTPTTFVTLENGAQRPATFVDAHTLRVTLNDADFTHTGKTRLVLGTFMGLVCTGATDPVQLDVLPAVQEQLVTVHEFYNAALDRYFRTASDAEATSIRANPATGEQDTGQPFKAWASNGHPASATIVYRFYGSVNPGPNSHFFTANLDEARSLQRAELDTPPGFKRWNYEELAFAVKMPADGACPGDAPVRILRVYNDGFARGRDSNHRFLTDIGLYNQMLARGWVGEGTVMCAPL